MFSRKKRELMKTPSISKKNRAGSPCPQPSGCGRRPTGTGLVQAWGHLQGQWCLWAQESAGPSKDRNRGGVYQ
ncbi:hypothetical protein FD755_000774 [Muntiacus reevesi]|uniref:Uncharacterized protein n=2 Tax=Muntiacus TaxID=9885 RepID=A0A5J5MZD2_MUNRE|nr:hypothetical protein FD754_007369 [Muntiacus muntjak]KAB0385818.1 hypothetical protein FD755_000774 [Muntiacus reevesi]